MIDFTNIEYLKAGNAKQVQTYKILKQNKILEVLAAFNPILVGTVPINIDIENSDLDIICFWKNKAFFKEKLTLAFGQRNKFTIRETMIDDEESIIANFEIEGFEVEIFGQNIPTKEQNGYKHMIIEYKILQSKGESFRLEIIELKQNGYKTEPAFAYLLNLKGDPYRELLKYKI